MLHPSVLRTHMVWAIWCLYKRRLERGVNFSLISDFPVDIIVHVYFIWWAISWTESIFTKGFRPTVTADSFTPRSSSVPIPWSYWSSTRCMAIQSLQILRGLSPTPCSLICIHTMYLPLKLNLLSCIMLPTQIAEMKDQK